MRYATDATAFSSAVPPKWTAIAGGDDREHVVPDLANGTRYYFEVRAYGQDAFGHVVGAADTTTVQLAASPNAAVEIPDERLRDNLLPTGKAWEDPITQLDMAMRDQLYAQRSEIQDLTGLEYMVNAVSLHLENNQISNLSPLGALTALKGLYLDSNEVVDVSALGGLTGLTHLSAPNNNIADISALSGLTALRHLSLYDNEIEEVSALRSSTELEYLYLHNNQIVDVSALGNMQALFRLYLNNNQIVNVTALGNLGPLSQLRLSDNRIVDVSALGGLSVGELWLDNNEIGDVSTFDGLARVYELSLANNRIVDVSALGELSGLRSLVLSNNEIVDVSALGELTNPTSLHLDNNRISDVSALGNLTEVDLLYLQNNQIKDVSALGRLEDVNWLWLHNNEIEDVSALGDLTDVSHLRLNDNQIADVSALGNLTRMRGLWLHGNRIEDVSALGNLTRLWGLCLANNEIKDVSALGSLNPQWLDLSANAITDVSALGSLSQLAWIDLSGNAITDVSALRNLVRLSYLNLDDNRIADVSTIEGLRRLYIENNQIADVSTLAGRFTTGSEVALRGNRLSADSIEALRADGATVLAGWQVPLFPSAGDPSGREGFVRVLNRTDSAGAVVIEAVDDAGVRSEPARLSIGAGRAAHFNSRDLEGGNTAKGLQSGVGAPTVGGWRLELFSALDLEVLGYIRTPDGFVTSVHGVVPRHRRPCWDPELLWPSDLRSAIFNPARNTAQRSSLRLINASPWSLDTTIWGIDDLGGVRVAEVPVRPGAATATAEQLQRLGLGVGAGKWRLNLPAPRWLDAMSLLESPGGHLTNLSTAPAGDADGVWRAPFFPAASNTAGQGFVRIANLAPASAEAAIVATDDGGRRATTALELAPRQTVHLNSSDLEHGNDAKGLARGVGSPAQGDWRLEIKSESDIRVTSFVRGPGGFLTSMHDVVPAGGDDHEVVFFNPARNTRQVSLLRLANDSDAAAAVTIAGLDDAANPSGVTSASIPRGHAVTFTATQLEEGAPGLAGRLGTGHGKWRLRVTADRQITVMSLLRNATGHLTNLSSRGRFRVGAASQPARERRGVWRPVAERDHPLAQLVEGGVGERDSAEVRGRGERGVAGRVLGEARRSDPHRHR